MKEKKNFKQLEAVDRLFDPVEVSPAPAQETDEAEQTQTKVGRPKQAGEYYRFNLKTPIEYKQFLDEASWKARKTVTQYINDLIREKMDKEQEGGQP